MTSQVGNNGTWAELNGPIHIYVYNDPVSRGSISLRIRLYIHLPLEPVPTKPPTHLSSPLSNLSPPSSSALVAAPAPSCNPNTDRHDSFSGAALSPRWLPGAALSIARPPSRRRRFHTFHRLHRPNNLRPQRHASALRGFCLLLPAENSVSPSRSRSRQEQGGAYYLARLTYCFLSSFSRSWSLKAGPKVATPGADSAVICVQGRLGEGGGRGGVKGGVNH